MKRNNKTLYEKIMRGISEQIKYTLNEAAEQFNVIDYQDDDIVDYSMTKDILKGKFKELSDDAYNKWIEYDGFSKIEEYINMPKQVLFNSGQEQLFNSFKKRIIDIFKDYLKNAVYIYANGTDNDWFAIGESCGYSKEELDVIFNDEYLNKAIQVLKKYIYKFVKVKDDWWDNNNEYEENNYNRKSIFNDNDY